MNPEIPNYITLQEASKFSAINAQLLINAQIEFMVSCVGVHDKDELKNLAVKIFESKGIPFDLIGK